MIVHVVVVSRGATVDLWQRKEEGEGKESMDGSIAGEE